VAWGGRNWTKGAGRLLLIFIASLKVQPTNNPKFYVMQEKSTAYEISISMKEGRGPRPANLRALPIQSSFSRHQKPLKKFLNVILRITNIPSKKDKNHYEKF
jgi:hypothetical protein